VKLQIHERMYHVPRGLWARGALHCFADGSPVDAPPEPLFNMEYDPI
jgi:hypothetical protein